MLHYQPNSESCLIGCYGAEEVDPTIFPRQVTGFSIKAMPSSQTYPCLCYTVSLTIPFFISKCCSYGAFAAYFAV